MILCHDVGWRNPENLYHCDTSGKSHVFSITHASFDCCGCDLGENEYVYPGYGTRLCEHRKYINNQKLYVQKPHGYPI